MSSRSQKPNMSSRSQKSTPRISSDVSSEAVEAAVAARVAEREEYLAAKEKQLEAEHKQKMAELELEAKKTAKSQEEKMKQELEKIKTATAAQASGRADKAGEEIRKKAEAEAKEMKQSLEVEAAAQKREHEKKSKALQAQQQLLASSANEKSGGGGGVSIPGQGLAKSLLPFGGANSDEDPDNPDAPLRVLSKLGFSDTINFKLGVFVVVLGIVLELVSFGGLFSVINATPEKVVPLLEMADENIEVMAGAVSHMHEEMSGMIEDIFLSADDLISFYKGSGINMTEVHESMDDMKTAKMAIAGTIKSMVGVIFEKLQFVRSSSLSAIQGGDALVGKMVGMFDDFDAAILASEDGFDKFAKVPPMQFGGEQLEVALGSIAGCEVIAHNSSALVAELGTERNMLDGATETTVDMIEFMYVVAHVCSGSAECCHSLQLSMGIDGDLQQIMAPLNADTGTTTQMIEKALKLITSISDYMQTTGIMTPHMAELFNELLNTLRSFVETVNNLIDQAVKIAYEVRPMLEQFESQLEDMSAAVGTLDSVEASIDSQMQLVDQLLVKVENHINSMSKMMDMFGGVSKKCVADCDGPSPVMQKEVVLVQQIDAIMDVVNQTCTHVRLALADSVVSLEQPVNSFSVVAGLMLLVGASSAAVTFIFIIIVYCTLSAVAKGFWRGGALCSIIYGWICKCQLGCIVFDIIDLIMMTLYSMGFTTLLMLIKSISTVIFWVLSLLIYTLGSTCNEVYVTCSTEAPDNPSFFQRIFLGMCGDVIPDMCFTLRPLQEMAYYLFVGQFMGLMGCLQMYSCMGPFSTLLSQGEAATQRGDTSEIQKHATAIEVGFERGRARWFGELSWDLFWFLCHRFPLFAIFYSHSMARFSKLAQLNLSVSSLFMCIGTMWVCSDLHYDALPEMMVLYWIGSVVMVVIIVRCYMMVAQEMYLIGIHFDRVWCCGFAICCYPSINFTGEGLEFDLLHWLITGVGYGMGVFASMNVLASDGPDMVIFLWIGGSVAWSVMMAVDLLVLPAVFYMRWAIETGMLKPNKTYPYGESYPSVAVLKSSRWKPLDTGENMFVD